MQGISRDQNLEASSHRILYSLKLIRPLNIGVYHTVQLRKQQ